MVSLFLNKIITNIPNKLSLGLLNRLHHHSLLRGCDEVFNREFGIVDAIPDDGNHAEHAKNAESPRGTESVVFQASKYTSARKKNVYINMVDTYRV